MNDELYERLMERVTDPTAYVRKYPQNRIVAFCREREIRVLDLLAAERRGQRVERVYHLRDTHWYARGGVWRAS